MRDQIGTLLRDRLVYPLRALRARLVGIALAVEPARKRSRMDSRSRRPDHTTPPQTTWRKAIAGTTRVARITGPIALAILTATALAIAAAAVAGRTSI